MSGIRIWYMPFELPDPVFRLGIKYDDEQGLINDHTDSVLHRKTRQSSHT